MVVVSQEDVAEDRFVNTPIELETLIECVKGTNIGLKGRVKSITRCYYRFETQVEGQIKLKMVKKEFARPIVDWETGIGVFQVPDANKKNEPHPDILKLTKKKRKSESDLVHLVE